MNILAMETSGKTFSVAVFSEGTVKGEVFLNTGNTHSETLLPAAQNLLKNLNLSLAGIDKFAVCSGPGSFTGIRIAMTAAKVFAQSLDKPLVSIDSLTLLEHAVPVIKNIKVVAAIDALRDEVYTKTSKGIVIKNINKFVQELSKYKGKVLIAGNAALKYREVIKKGLSAFSVSLDENFHYPKASVLACLASTQKGVSFDKAEPLYLRRSWAEEVTPRANKKVKLNSKRKK
ncbi:MAG: tRNA (adenosine(37)-N6)-threonylcarbamoyltransferase complex dimerization subunit type 1 TsaB [Elusimicrobia bacterium]|nr:tRNA (adenosine(37)-N6)-threonylcarbamoyltransferase complex dimerization subunit type 1 TsaB [Elusimicrobiota bacterium]